MSNFLKIMAGMFILGISLSALPILLILSWHVVSDFRFDDFFKICTVMFDLIGGMLYIGKDPVISLLMKYPKQDMV